MPTFTYWYIGNTSSGLRPKTVLFKTKEAAESHYEAMLAKSVEEAKASAEAGEREYFASRFSVIQFDGEVLDG